MKINHEYLKGLLETFEKSSKTYTDVDELMGHGYNHNQEEFSFHMLILKDNNFIEGYANKDDIGYQMMGDRTHRWFKKPLRLTAVGHEYISNLNEPTVWDEIQKDFKESSVATVKMVATDIVKAIVKKKVNDLL